MIETRSAHPGFDFLHKAALTLLVFQVATAVKLTMEHGLDGPMDRFPILIMCTALLIAPIRRLAGSGYSNGGAGWIVASRAIFLFIFLIATLAFAFRESVSPTGADALLKTVFSLMWAGIALKGAAAGKFRPGGPFGLCIYWTTHSRLAWDKAHRALGRILFWGGLAGLAASFALPPLMSLALWAATVICAVLIAAFVSWRAWRSDPNRF